MNNDQAFARIEVLFDIKLFADVKVLIVGCGSGGSSVALQLVMSGVRNFTLLDKDVLEIENVIRHVCGRRYVGQKKVDAVEDILLDRNPKANIRKIEADIMDYPDMESVIIESDVVVLATDQSRPHFDNGDATAETSVHLREFEANVAAADNDEVRRHEVDIHHGDVVKVGYVFDTVQAWRCRASTDVNENSLSGQQSPIDADLARAREARMAAD